jgi:hypothetical protein
VDVDLFAVDVDLFAGIAVSELSGPKNGIDPQISETYENGVRKVISRDPDGNEVDVGVPQSCLKPNFDDAR